MTSPFDDQLNIQQPHLFGMHIGTVTDRIDPEGLGRIRFTIPGMIEPQGPWAWPLGTVGGGSKDRGFFAVPELGAEVAIWFDRGSLEVPYYLAGHWGKPGGQSEVPEEAQKTPPDNRVLATETFRIEIDESKGGRVIRIVNRKTQEDFLEFNAERNTVTISGTTAIIIQAVGSIDIRAARVQIQGRPVTPSTSPI